MCGIMGCVVQFVELVGYLGCDVKKMGLQLHLVFPRGISHRIFWEIWVGTFLLLSILDEINVYHDISIRDCINFNDSPSIIHLYSELGVRVFFIRPAGLHYGANMAAPKIEFGHFWLKIGMHLKH